MRLAIVLIAVCTAKAALHGGALRELPLLSISHRHQCLTRPAPRCCSAPPPPPLPPHRAGAPAARAAQLQRAVAIGSSIAPTALALAVTAAILQAPSLRTAPPLFKLHVACLSPIVPLGTAAVLTVRQRAAAGVATGAAGGSPTQRRAAVSRQVKRHLVLAAGAMYVAALGLISIYRHKNRMGKAHLTTVHSWVGGAAFITWVATYLQAQTHVWAPLWKQRRWAYEPNLLWASRLHRKLGTAAYALSLAAVGVVVGGGWGANALGSTTANAACAALAAIAALVFMPPLLRLRARGRRRRRCN